MSIAPIAIIHDNIKIAKPIQRCLNNAGYPTQWYTVLESRQHELNDRCISLVISDEHAQLNQGQSIDETLKTEKWTLPIILLAEKPSIQRAVEAIKIGASDYLSAPVEARVLIAAVEKILSIEKSVNKQRNSRRRTGFHIITCAESMIQLLSMAQRVANSSATVLIQGESGTGKELLARYIHLNSDRNRQPFVAMNCAALPDNLAESELFGYEKGAFTGAHKARMGKFEQAHKGTLLLDEISEMPMALQAKLLRVLQEKEVDHLGGGKPVQVDVRCIASSNQDLQTMVKEGHFRKDLYYRLRVIPLHIPPLRERKEDIPGLLDYFIDKFHSGNGMDRPKIDDDALAYLHQWTWPGNVRELENAVERAMLISAGPIIDKSSLLLEQELNGSDNAPDDGLIGMTVKEMEKKLIGQTLSHLNHNRTHAAKMLGISIRTLRNKLREYQENEKVNSNETQGN